MGAKYVFNKNLSKTDVVDILSDIFESDELWMTNNLFLSKGSVEQKKYYASIIAGFNNVNKIKACVLSDVFTGSKNWKWSDKNYLKALLLIRSRK